MRTPGGDDLIRAMAGGDRDAFARFYDRYAPLVLPFVLRIVRDRTDAADVLQDVVWEAWRGAAAYDSARGTPEAWLITRARTRAIDRVRAMRRRGETFVAPVDDATVGAPTPPGGDAAERAEDRQLVASAPARLPDAPRGGREALVSGVARAGPAGRRRWLAWAAATAVAAAAAAGFTGTWVAVRYEAQLGRMAREMAALKERTARNETALQEQVALYRGAVELLRDPATRVVELRGQGPAARASGRMVWTPAGGGHLFVAGLPPAPAGKTYELWTIAGQTPRPAGLFGVDAAGRGAHRVPTGAVGGAVQVFAVTLEPEGGTPAPTGPIVLASK